MLKLLLLFLFPLILLAKTESVSLQLDWKHQFEFAGFYAAKSQGYYKDIGLEVEFKDLKDGMNISDEVINGRSEFGISSSSLILDKLQNRPVLLLASYFKQNALALVTSPDIKTINDLKNKKIMATQHEFHQTSLGVMLQENQIIKGDYTAIKQDFKVDKFVNGEIDAMSVFITNQLYILDKKNVKYNLFSPADYGIYSYDGELFTSESFAHKNPKLVRSFIDATNRGWEYAFSHKKEIVNLIYRDYNSKKSKDALLYEANYLEKIFKIHLFKIGSVVPELVELNAVIYKKLGLVKSEVNLKTLLNDYIFDHEYTKVEPYKEMQFTREEQAFLDEAKVIKIANEMDWPPFDYNEFGKPKGLGIEYVKLLFDKVGIKYEFVNGYTWNEILILFKEKKVDVLPAFYKNKEREKYTNFTTPYYKGELAIFTLNGNTKINSANDLVDIRVGIEKSDASATIIKKQFKNTQIIEIDTNHQLIKELSLKNIDAIIGNPKLFHHHLIEEDISTIHQIDTVSLNEAQQKTISLYIGVREDYKLLYSIIQKAIFSLNENEIVSLKKQWVSDSDNEVIKLTTKEINYLNSKDIRMCIDPEWLPFEKLEDGKHIGMSADFFKLIEKNLNVKIRVIPTDSWHESIEFAKNRKCDIFSLAMQTKQRKEYMDFTTPYLSIPLVLATNLNAPFVVDFKTLNGKKIGIPKDYAFSEILKKRYPLLNIVEVENIKDGMNRVKSKELYGYVGTLASVAYVFQTEFTGQLKIAGKFDDKWELGIAVRNDDPLLLAILQKAVNSISETQKREILNHWVAINYEKGIDYTLVWQVLIIALIILLSVLFWARKLSLLNDELKQSKIKSDESTKAKANFLSNMSHEIRTPMNSIVGMSYLIKETNLNKIQSEYIQKIETASNNLLTLINDILDFSKLEARKLQIRKINFNLLEVLNNVENILTLKSYEKGLELKITYEKSYSMHLYGDSLRLSQILINLVSNAIKFTNKGKVELIVEKLNETRFKFSVVDTGIGLTEIQQKDIFSSFTQADSSITRKYGGTGLGLAISKELVELMGGKISLESTFHKGSTFSFEIDLETSKEKTKEPIVSTISKEVIIDRQNLIKDSAKVQELFIELKNSCKKRRPKLCEPILQQLQEYDLNEDDLKLFNGVSLLIKRYKFDEAWRMIDGK